MTKTRYSPDRTVSYRLLSCCSVLGQLSKLVGTVEFLHLEKLNHQVRKYLGKFAEDGRQRDMMITELREKFPSAVWQAVYKFATRHAFKPDRAVTARL